MIATGAAGEGPPAAGATGASGEGAAWSAGEGATAAEYRLQAKVRRPGRQR